jgi:hypothetical protein
LTTGDRAILGVFTGIIAAVTDAIASIPLAPWVNAFYRNIMEKLAEYSGEMPEGWEEWFERGTENPSFFWAVLGFLMAVLVFSALGALGGVIGVTIFGKKKWKVNQGDSNVTEEKGDSQNPDNR